uniref:Ycf2 N-terminal domain-containing protein n=1 Tax=Helianthus annuus TaxID=4232 RepID=A0A1Y3BWJ7_HELAN
MRCLNGILLVLIIRRNLMTGHEFKSLDFRIERDMREIKNSHYFLDSWTQFNSVGSSFTFFSTKNVYKLFDSRIWSILLSHNSQGSTSNRYFTIKGVNTLCTSSGP